MFSLCYFVRFSIVSRLFRVCFTRFLSSPRDVPSSLLLLPFSCCSFLYSDCLPFPSSSLLSSPSSILLLSSRRILSSSAPLLPSFSRSLKSLCPFPFVPFSTCMFHVFLHFCCSGSCCCLLRQLVVHVGISPCLVCSAVWLLGTLLSLQLGLLFRCLCPRAARGTLFHALLVTFFPSSTGGSWARLLRSFLKASARIPTLSFSRLSISACLVANEAVQQLQSTLSNGLAGSASCLSLRSVELVADPHQCGFPSVLWTHLSMCCHLHQDVGSEALHLSVFELALASSLGNVCRGSQEDPTSCFACVPFLAWLVRVIRMPLQLQQYLLVQQHTQNDCLLH